VEIADLRALWLKAWEKADPQGPLSLYTTDPNYLATTIVWESGGRKQDVYRAMEEWFPDKELVIMDLGCASGLTGMTLLLKGYKHCTFCDFEGIALSILRELLPEIPEFAGRYNVVAYGREVSVDVIVATDVLEHVGKHLNFLRWVGELSKEGFVLTYPFRPFEKPYEGAIDGWVDDEAVEMILRERHELLEWSTMSGGRLAVVKK